MLHQNMVHDSTRQSERDEPRNSYRACLCNGTKMTAMERIGNLHELLVLTYTQSGCDIIKPILRKHRITISKWRDCIKLQLSFEKWVHDHNILYQEGRYLCALFTKVTSRKTSIGEF